MIVLVPRIWLERFWASLSIIVLILLGIVSLSFSMENVDGLNITNETVIARVNVSNTFPNLYLVRITSPLDINNNIDLTAGNTTTLLCNGTFQDANGFDDVTKVNATLYFDNVGSNASDNNMTHYSNSSCGTCPAVPGSGNQNGTCSCQFAVQYYANYGNWRCNMTVTDTGLLESTYNSTTFFMNEVVGIDLYNLTIDYGPLSVTSTSQNIPENVSNVGNVPINITVRGYGGTNETEGINVTMICETGANITFGNQRYSTVNSTAFDDMRNLTNQTTMVPALTIPTRTNGTTAGNSTNTTFWKLRIPIGPSGICNGTIIFGARDGR